MTIRIRMLSSLFVFVILLVISSSAVQPATMRLDYYHTGNATQEVWSLDRVVIEPLTWPGDLSKAIDDTNLGNYFFEVHDLASGKLLYSRGFGSLFSEWAQTDEAITLNRTFSESLRFPRPDKPVKIVLKERREGKDVDFHEVWTTTVNPRDKFIDTANPPSPGPLLTIQKNGEPETKVNLLILGDGYTAPERTKFEADAKRATEILFSRSPFKEHRKDFNVWGLCPAAAQPGISRPSTGIYLHPPLGTSYDTFDSERYIMTTDNKALRDVASFAPYQFIEILTNSRTYGGGGIYNLYATVAADSEWMPYVFVHEFGHEFAGLADEYYTSDVSVGSPEKRIEPWEPNVTALLDPAMLKWKDPVTAGTPIPTPWKKAEFEAYEKDIQAERRQIRKENRPEAEMNALFEKEKKQEDQLLATDKYSDRVGAFEGANYEAKEYYRPQENCIMFTRYDKFCEVCSRAIERVIALYATQ
jgi:IgA Peptidase M64/Peptidase M64 N-terminus